MQTVATPNGLIWVCVEKREGKRVIYLPKKFEINKKKKKYTKKVPIRTTNDGKQKPRIHRGPQITSMIYLHWRRMHHNLQLTYSVDVKVQRHLHSQLEYRMITNLKKSEIVKGNFEIYHLRFLFFVVERIHVQWMWKRSKFLCPSPP